MKKTSPKLDKKELKKYLKREGYIKYGDILSYLGSVLCGLMLGGVGSVIVRGLNDVANIVYPIFEAEPTFTLLMGCMIIALLVLFSVAATLFVVFAGFWGLWRSKK